MHRTNLVPDCGSCDALCCVATSFTTSRAFAFDKPAGVACPHLTQRNRCGIHDQLAARGFPGCAAYDCHGAGQRVTGTFASRRGSERERDECFRILREIHELLWQLTAAIRLCPDGCKDLRSAIAQQIDALDGIAVSSAAVWLATDLGPLRTAQRALLRWVGDALAGQGRRSLQ